MQARAQCTHSDVWSQLAFNARVFVQNWKPTEREETVKLQWEGDMQREGWYWRWARSKPLPGCL